MNRYSSLEAIQKLRARGIKSGCNERFVFPFAEFVSCFSSLHTQDRHRSTSNLVNLISPALPSNHDTISSFNLALLSPRHVRTREWDAVWGMSFFVCGLSSCRGKKGVVIFTNY